MPTSLLARRAARIAFGLVLVLGMLVLVAFALHYGFRRMPIHAWQILLGTWLAAFATAALVRMLARGITPGEPNELAEHRQRVAALAVPAVGIALIAPLTVHAIVYLLGNVAETGTWGGLERARDGFDEWVVLSLLLTGPAHITFATLAGRRAAQLARGAIEVSVRRIYIATLIAACIPGIVLLLPPVVVALTGLPMLPLLYWMPRIAERDREEGVGLPAAVARVA